MASKITRLGDLKDCLATVVVDSFALQIIYVAHLPHVFCCRRLCCFCGGEGLLNKIVVRCFLFALYTPAACFFSHLFPNFD